MDFIAEEERMIYEGEQQLTAVQLDRFEANYLQIHDLRFCQLTYVRAGSANISEFGYNMVHK